MFNVQDKFRRIKEKLLSSILYEKLVFTGKKYRTPKFKEGFAFIYMSINRLQREKTKKGNNLSNASLNVPGAGLEPARPNGHRILSPACLPIPPPGQF